MKLGRDPIWVIPKSWGKKCDGLTSVYVEYKTAKLRTLPSFGQKSLQRFLGNAYIYEPSAQAGNRCMHFRYFPTKSICVIVTYKVRAGCQSYMDIGQKTSNYRDRFQVTIDIDYSSLSRRTSLGTCSCLQCY